jgi:hypothetical protein
MKEARSYPLLRRQITLVRDACPHGAVPKRQCPEFRAVGASFAGAFVREFLPLVAMWRAKRCQEQKTKRPSQIKKFNWFGGDLTEEKRHAAAITRVVEFGQ